MSFRPLLPLLIFLAVLAQVLDADGEGLPVPLLLFCRVDFVDFPLHLPVLFD